MKAANWILVLGGATLIAAAIATATGAISSSGGVAGAPDAVVDELRPPSSDSGSTAAPSSSSRAGIDSPAGWRPPAGTPHPVSSTSTSTSTTPPQVAPPVGLRISKLGVDAPVAPYGVDADSGEMEVPANVSEVAWYRFGPAPGEPGSAVLAAHVDLAGQGPGVFFDLDELDVDDIVSVDHADGSSTDYRVVARTVYPKEDLPLDAVFSRSGPPILTLITCGGGFDRSDRRYHSNVVVFAVAHGTTDTRRDPRF